ncbi:hypothetical protein JOC95_003268 [Bacillus tianshenii]|uniref:DUF5673 domain-containing protein n=1 Tax=Sutcliffiella tianshenii TaxID=1463404 RepID=A0ABS2P4S7_9BACI|nr:hypothetical protein [Bacillus tianshenii]MBM7621395.1 hypothetical protein [Bacillus tianshenii]
MEFIQQHSFYLFLIFIGLLLIYESITKYRTKGVSSTSNSDRYRRVLYGAMLSLVLLIAFIQMDLQKEAFVAVVGPLLIGLLTMVKERKNTELHVFSYEPYTFFEILEKLLNSHGYGYFKEVKGNDDYLSSNYITYYYLDDGDEEIKINWKDLDKSDLQVSFLRFGDKAFIEELMKELKERRPPITYFKFNKYSLGFAAVFIYLGMMKVLGY